MKAKTASPETAVLTAERKLHNTWVYIKRHWQLYLLFLLPAVVLTLVFKYAPMGGVLIAFQKYNPFKGHLGQRVGRLQKLYPPPPPPPGPPPPPPPPGGAGGGGASSR